MNYQNKTFNEMQKDCISFAIENKTLWESNSAINENMEALIANDAALEADLLQQSQNTSGGQVKTKNNLIATLLKTCYKVSCQLSFFAKDTNNSTLLADVSLSETALKQTNESDILLHAALISKRGRDYAAQAAGYGVTTAVLDGIDAEIVTIKAMPPVIHMLTADNKILTQNIYKLIAAARVILDKLDDAFEGLVDDDTFLAGWFNVRKIKGRHHPAKAAPEPVVNT